jgi:hypothetical protein
VLALHSEARRLQSCLQRERQLAGHAPATAGCGCRRRRAQLAKRLDTTPGCIEAPARLLLLTAHARAELGWRPRYDRVRDHPASQTRQRATMAKILNFKKLSPKDRNKARPQPA